MTDRMQKRSPMNAQSTFAMDGLQVPLVQVALPLPIDTIYTYALPAEMQETVQLGSRVMVPLGSRQLVGYVVGMGGDPPGARLKAVLDVLDEVPLLTDELVEFCRRLSSYYLCSLGEVLKAALPPGINGTTRSYFSLQSDVSLRSPIVLTERRRAILRLVEERGALSRSYLTQELNAAIHHDLGELLRAHFLEKRDEHRGLRDKGKKRRVLKLSLPAGDASYYTLLELKRRRAPRQAQLLELLLESAELCADRSELLAEGYSADCMKRLLEEEGVEELLLDALPVEDAYGQDDSVREIQLSHAQELVVTEVAKRILPLREKTNAFEAFLLHGVTGSGKTQVYMDLARKAQDMGKSVLVLVPEIALTPQIVARFRAMLGPHVAVIHSRLSSAQRFQIFQSLRRGDCRAVVGARSAVFAPLKNLGLIIVDEEHENSYKQFDPAPRYNARDAAVVRAHQLGIPVLLGSATPSMESWQNTRAGRYTLLSLPERVRGRLPEVELVDMQENLESLRGRGKTVRAFGDTLIKAMLDTLERGEKIILLQNRRGHSPWLQCAECAEPVQCVRCDVSLTFHRTTQKAHCHLCGLEIDPPKTCPSCGHEELFFLGMGTQRVEEELQEAFPQARVLRMDRDTTGAHDAYIRMVREFNEGDYDILLGTQSVAKGLDFSAVTLVGVIHADTELNLQDFRAEEWTYQLISQVAGRAGRGDKPGRVIVQTFRPDNTALLLAAQHDYHTFAVQELRARHELFYPPFSRFCRLLVKSAKEELAESACQRLHEIFKVQPPVGVLASEPGPAPLLKVRREFRHHLLLRSRRDQDPSGQRLRRAVLGLRDHFNKKLKQTGLTLAIDMDPQALI
jgi:primosomal protein N' (replication factor Y) (superfamily II helicase)